MGIWYSPWGENLYEQHSNSGVYDSPYRFNGKELDEETGNYYYGARYYNPQISMWLSVDPLVGNNLHLTPYNFSSNNPIVRIDPDGMDDGWVEDECGNTTYDPDVHSQKDLVEQRKSGTYKGEEGVGFNPETGNRVMYNNDGSSFEYSQMLYDVEVDGGKMSDHARNLQNPIVQAIHQGQNNFLRGTALLTAHVTGQVGTGISYVGYGAAFVPGAQPIAGGLITVGGGLSAVSSLSTAAINFPDGDNQRGALNLINVSASFILDNSIGGAVTQQGKNILRGGINTKSGIADYLINR